MAFVLDCSVTMAWVFSDEASAVTDSLRESLIDDSAFVPALWPVETANVLLTATRRGRIAKSEWGRIREDLRALPINIDHVATDRVWGATLDLAEAYRISAYDAMYLELALRLRLPLATLDRALATAARASGVGVPWSA
ncbi:MAG: type II toxin-antitoxin system VapC family toxin [Bryobacterales bacterium]|nr:type II toxin-antitoxin system VapC family toxin [Bryobacterales bacterium]MDE0265239.1 type II toxin-antitoxin system VapC family toxin [Bryobacterales bacterium]